MNFETWLQSDLTKPLKVQALHGVFFSADNAANLIGVEVVDGGAPADLSGTCIGYAIRADGGTLTITGTVSGNKASVILPASAYVLEGPLDIVIKVVSGSVKTTVGACRGYVQRATTDTIIDPGHVIPSLEELLALIEPMEQGTAAANAAAASANSAATNANSKAGEANTAATSANNAASTANTAATNANTARDNANAAAAAANAAAAAAPTQITSQETAFQNSTSGTTIPTGTWLDTQPTTPQGQFLWIRQTLTWDNGETTTLYSVSRMGVDGSGSVVSVNGLSPDANGNVNLGDIVHTVNGTSPDSAGNVALGSLVKKVNNTEPDSSGNVPLGDIVHTVNGISPDSSGNVPLPIDDAPASGSSNPVKSSALKAIQDGYDADIAGLTSNVTDLAADMGAAKATVGIVEDGDTATHNISAGHYVIWKGALYTATEAIAVDTALSTANLTAAPNGLGNQVTPVALGGTGATTVNGAITNINGAYAKVRAGTKVIAASSDGSYGQLFTAAQVSEIVGGSPGTASYVTITAANGDSTAYQNGKVTVTYSPGAGVWYAQFNPATSAGGSIRVNWIAVRFG